MDISRLPPVPAWKLLHPETPRLFDNALFYFNDSTQFLNPILFDEATLNNGESATFSLKQTISKDSGGNLKLSVPVLVKDE